MGFHEDGEIILKDLVKGQVARKTLTFNPGLSQILSKVFLSKNMQLELYTKYCWAFTPRNSNNNNTKFYSKQYIGK